MAIGTDMLIGLGSCASGVGEDTKGSAIPAHHALEVFYIFWVDGAFVALALKYAESVLGSELPVTSPVATIAAVSSDEGPVALEARQDEFLEDEWVDAPKIAEGPGVTRLWVFGRSVDFLNFSHDAIGTFDIPFVANVSEKAKCVIESGKPSLDRSRKGHDHPQSCA